MTTGEINNRRARVSLFVFGEGGQGKVEFTLDTGFTGELTLPRQACIALKLPEKNRQLAYLADGSAIDLLVYRVQVLLDEVEREYEVLAIESEPLLGMTFLEGYEVCLEVIENGVVRLNPL